MKPGDVITSEGSFTFAARPVYRWHLHPFGRDAKVVWHMQRAPHAFHRLMQWLVFGFVWERMLPDPPRPQSSVDEELRIW